MMRNDGFPPEGYPTGWFQVAWAGWSWASIARNLSRDGSSGLDGMVHHDIADVAVGSGDVVCLFRRNDPTIVVYTAEGSHIASFGEGAIVGQAHGIAVDQRDGSVLLVDKNGHSVPRFDAAGKLVQEIKSLRHEAPATRSGATS